MKKVTIYSTPTCHFCDVAKKFFDTNKIKYVAHDVSNDGVKRQEMRDLSGAMTVPVIVIGKEVIVGFAEDKIKELLNIK